VADNDVSPSEFYSRRASEVDSAAQDANDRCRKCQTAGLLFLLLSLLFLYEALVPKRLPLWAFALPFAAFVYTARGAQSAGHSVLKQLSVREFYDKGTARLRRSWDSLDEGKDFIDRDHIYASDLDLFGRGSLFQLLCAARTRAGREMLASWMKTRSEHDEALARQSAIAELRTRYDLREAVAAAGRSSVVTLRSRTIRDWVNEVLSAPALPGWIHPVALTIVIAMAAAPIFYWLGPLSLQNVWLGLGAACVVEAAFSYGFLKRVRYMLESSESRSVELPILADLLQIIEYENFISPKLAVIRNRVTQGTVHASRQVRRLHRLVWLLQLRNSLAPLSLLLWGTQFSTAVDRWHRCYGRHLIEWIEAVAEFEAIVSLSAYAFEHAADVFPEFVDDRPLFAAEGLGHPLIDEKVCVRNDVSLSTDARFLIVSGSNMSGKSTFLRAVGANAVLAWMGAPVRSQALRISGLSVAAAIRVQDSLADGQSHFFAEMQRLRRMIDLASQGPVLFLIDEIMSGTNSKDRRVAAEWVMRALVHRGAIGLITTHDLTLTEIASNGLEGRNVYFEDSGQDGQLHFDYALRSGLPTHSNALNIVRMLGIDPER
jgi:MutS domain V